MNFLGGCEPTVISVSSVQSPFSVIRNTEWVPNCPNAKPHVMPWPLSKSVRSVSRKLPSLNAHPIDPTLVVIGDDPEGLESEFAIRAASPDSFDQKHQPVEL